MTHHEDLHGFRSDKDLRGWSLNDVTMQVKEGFLSLFLESSMDRNCIIMMS